MGVQDLSSCSPSVNRRGTRRTRRSAGRPAAVALAGTLLLAPPLARAGTPGAEPLVPPITLHLTIPNIPEPRPTAPTFGFDLSTPDEATDDFWTSRYEPAGLPLLGGNSDIGFQFGAAATLTHFDRGSRPYAWNMDLVLNTSVKGGSGQGVAFQQQNYVWNWDIPDLLGGRVRLNPLVYYQRTIDQGYFGLGNASRAVPAPGSPRFFQYLDSELRARQLARIKLGKGYDLVLITTVRAESPTAYPGTLLALDAATKNTNGTPLVRGVLPGAASTETGIGMAGAGFMYDTRDNEVFPRSGAFHQVGIKAVQGLPLDRGIDYGAVGANFAWMVPLFHRSVVLAMRLLADLEFGNVPFYDLFTGGTFQTYDMLGGPTGIRGVPSGRYLGRIKTVGNVELRSLPIGFHVLHQTFHLGGSLLFDTGRLWLDYTFRSPLDGSGVGLKYGVGGGLYALWGQAALFRIDVAYSPDQVAENPGFPVGIYVEEGVMF